MAERRVTVTSEVGLHARPAAMFVQAAAKAQVEISVAKAGAEPVDAKSILAVLSLDVRGGEEIVLRADGDGADQELDTVAGVASTAGPAA